MGSSRRQPALRADQRGTAYPLADCHSPSLRSLPDLDEGTGNRADPPPDLDSGATRASTGCLSQGKGSSPAVLSQPCSLLLRTRSVLWRASERSGQSGTGAEDGLYRAWKSRKFIHPESPPPVCRKYLPRDYVPCSLPCCARDCASAPSNSQPGCLVRGGHYALSA